MVYCVSSHPDEKYGKIQIPEQGTKVFFGNMILQAIHVLIAPQKKQKKENKLKDNKTKRQQYKKTKPKKRVYYCDVRAVSHSCDVLMFGLVGNIFVCV